MINTLADGGGGLASLNRAAIAPVPAAVAAPAKMTAIPNGSDPAADPLAALRAALLAQSPTADWNAGGVDRAQELAQLLNSKGITDLSKLSLGTKDFTSAAQADYTVKDADGNPTYDADGNPIIAMPTDDNGNPLPGFMDQYKNMNVLNYGDQSFGDTSGMDSRWLSDGNQFGWSAAGEGNVSYNVVKNPDGTTSIVPNWGSSSDAGLARDLALKGAIFAGGAAAAGAFGGAAGAGALGGAEAGAAGSGMTSAELAAGYPAYSYAGLGGTELGGFTAAEIAAGGLGPAQADAAFAAANGVSPAGSSVKDALYGDAGYGPGMTGAETTAADASLLDTLKNGYNTAKTGASWIQKLQNLIGGGGASSGGGGSGDMASLLAMLAAGGGSAQQPVDVIANVPKFDIDAWQKMMGGPQPQGDNQQALMALLSQQKRG